MLYTRTLLSIHPVCNSLHLLIPNSQSKISFQYLHRKKIFLSYKNGLLLDFFNSDSFCNWLFSFRVFVYTVTSFPCQLSVIYLFTIKEIQVSFSVVAKCSTSWTCYSSWPQSLGMTALVVFNIWMNIFAHISLRVYRIFLRFFLEKHLCQRACTSKMSITVVKWLLQS